MSLTVSDVNPRADKALVSKLDKSFATINYLLKKKKTRIDELGKRLEVSESQKIFIGEELELIKCVEDLIKRCKDEAFKHLGKIPPQAADLEVTVLGAILLEMPSLNKVISFLKVEHFYDEGHKEIYQAVINLFNRKESHDVRSVGMELRRTGKIELVGGFNHLAFLVDQVVNTSVIEYHARILVEMAIKRALIMMSSDIHHAAYEDTTDCFEMLESAEAQFKEINSWIRQ